MLPLREGAIFGGGDPCDAAFYQIFDHLLLLLCCCRMTLTLLLGWVTIFGRVYRLGM